MNVGLATLAAGRPSHLRRQAQAVAGLRGLARYVVVNMDAEPVAIPGARVVHLPGAPGRLPLAAARNRAIAELADCELVVLLDVDCLPTSDLVTRYRAAGRELGDRPGLLCGPVGYLDGPTEAAGGALLDRADAAALRRARERVIRQFPAAGIRREPRHELFWSLSCALTPATHAAIGGFDEAYEGYGAEDTDYGLRAREAGIGLWFVAGAWAYHQHHPPSGARSVPELGALVANCGRFHARWGFWPMGDRLTELVREGRIEWEPEGSECVVTAP